jgi:hypothetical protein
VEIPWPLLGFSSRPPPTENPGYVSDDSYMKALSYRKPLLWEAKKNILPPNILGRKYLALHFYRKKISILFPRAEKNYCTVWIFQPPSKIKWSAPYVSALGYCHRLAGVIDPTESFGYLKCWQDMKSLVHALTHASILRDMLQQTPILCSSCSSEYRAYLFKAMCTTAFFAFLRLVKLHVASQIYYYY